MSFWNALPQQIRTAIIGAALIIVGAASEWIVAWLNAISQPPV